MIDNLKFDLYCTYVSLTYGNLDNVCMHLTNYTINKNNENFIFNEDENKDNVRHKRSLKSTCNAYFLL